MNDLIQNALSLSVPLLCVGFVRFFPFPAWKLRILFVLTITSIALLIGMGVGSIEELPLLIQSSGHIESSYIVLLTVLLWSQFFVTGGVGPLQSKKWQYLIQGMSQGLIPLLFLSNKDSVHQKTIERRKKIVLSGTCIGVLGNPIFTLYNHQPIIIVVGIVALAYVLSIKGDVNKDSTEESDLPSNVDNQPAEKITPYQIMNRIMFSLISVVIIVSPFHAAAILFFGNLLLIPISVRNILDDAPRLQKPVTQTFFWYLFIVIMVNVSIISGTAELLSWGLEEIQFNYGNWFSIGVILLALVIGSLFDSIIILLLGTAIFSNALDLVDQNSAPYIVLGCLFSFLINGYFPIFTGGERLESNLENENNV